MDKKEFIEKFASSESMQERNKKATETSGGMVKFDCRQDIPSVDFCEVCIHPKGKTLNVFEMCTSFDGVDIPELVKDFKNRSKSYLDQEESGRNCQLILNLVVPPEPKMIMELGEHLVALMEIGGIVVNVYDPKNDKRGSCPLDEDFFLALKEDDAYAGMDDTEIFTNFMMNFVEML